MLKPQIYTDTDNITYKLYYGKNSERYYFYSNCTSEGAIIRYLIQCRKDMIELGGYIKREISKPYSHEIVAEIDNVEWSVLMEFDQEVRRNR